MKIKTQPDNYSCGVYSIINALIVYDEELSRKEVQNLTGTTLNGTSEKGLQKALTKLGYKYRVYDSKNKNNSWRWVLNNSNKKPLILYVDKDHWLVIAGRIQNKVIALDGHILNKKELLERWDGWGMSIN